MSIDWFTVGAQAINFLILMGLMKLFLFKPILHAIDEREERITTELAKAEDRMAEAQTQGEEFKNKNEVFDQERAALMSQAEKKAQTEGQRLMDEARQAAETLGTRRLETLKTEARELIQAIGDRTRREVFAITRKALTDLASTDLEERLAMVFISHLRELSREEKSVLAGAMLTGSEPAILCSAFDLPLAQRDLIQKALAETFSTEISVRFETVPNLISGIELTSNGQKVAWSFGGYLSSLEEGMTQLLEEKKQPEITAQHASEKKNEPERNVLIPEAQVR